jgi:hypothetical protein
MTDETQTPPETTGPIIEPPTKRGPGRPKKSEAAAPVSPSLDAQTPAAAKGKPGRKPKASKKMEPDALARQVEGLHQLMALALGVPELALQSQEAAMLGGAIAAVCDEYDLSLSGKTGALLQLAAAAAMVYGPRFVAVGQRVKQAQARAKASPLQVVGGTDGGAITPPL